MAGNRRRDNEPRAERSLSVRLSQSVLDEINECWEERGFANRTDLIETACKTYFESNICPRCRALNPPNGVNCSVCGETLVPYHKLQTKIYHEHEVFLDKIENLEVVLYEVGELLDDFEETLKRACEETDGQVTKKELDRYHDVLTAMREYRTMFIKDKEEIFSLFDYEIPNKDGEIYDLKSMIEAKIGNGLITPGKLQELIEEFQEGTRRASYYYNHLVRLERIILPIVAMLGLRCGGTCSNPPRSDSK